MPVQPFKLKESELKKNRSLASKIRKQKTSMVNMRPQMLSLKRLPWETGGITSTGSLQNWLDNVRGIVTNKSSDTVESEVPVSVSSGFNLS